MPPDRLAVFDVDGTLISLQGLAAESMARALTEVYGVPRPFEGYSLAGRTDLQITREALLAAGVPEDHILRDRAEAMNRYMVILEEALRTRPRGALKPGVRSLLDRLAGDDRWGVGLLTGNIRHGAEVKLRHFGIWEHFAFGAFGDDSEDRNALAPVALRRAREALGAAVPPENVFVVGDTIRDIACARAGGMRAVAVATGGDTYETLAAHKPDLLFDSLEDTETVLARFHQTLVPCA